MKVLQLGVIGGVFWLVNNNNNNDNMAGVLSKFVFSLLSANVNIIGEGGKVSSLCLCVCVV